MTPRTEAGRTIDASDNPALLGGMRAKNNGRYNGNGREWRTPPEVFMPLNREFGFTLDPCSTDANALCERHFTEADDGLGQDWGRERVFMNPPYGREVQTWTAKAKAAAEAGALVVALLPASTDLEWWHRDVMAAGAEVRYLRGRVRFLTDGPYRASGFFASVIVVWRAALEVAPRSPEPRPNDLWTLGNWAERRAAITTRWTGPGKEPMTAFEMAAAVERDRLWTHTDLEPDEMAAYDRRGLLNVIAALLDERGAP